VGLELKGEGMGIDPTKQSVNRSKVGEKEKKRKKMLGAESVSGKMNQRKKEE
jgi:hypothetical protein